MAARQEEVWYVTNCPECRENHLSGRNSGPCVYCGNDAGVTYTLDPTPRHLQGQEATVRALWDFAAAIGVDVKPDKSLQQIMSGFGYVVTEIQ